MAWTTAAGTTISISAGVPTAQTAAAYGTLTYTTIGEVTNISGVLGRQYNPVEHAALASAQRVQKKGSYTLSNVDVECAWDEKDAGQIMVLAGSQNNTIYAFQVVKQDGAKRFFQAQVSSMMENIGEVDSKVVGAITLLRQTDTITVAGP